MIALATHIQNTNLVRTLWGCWALNFKKTTENANHVNAFLDRPGGSYI